MSLIRPFRGLRPHPDYVAEVASPPYDVLSSDEARELVKRNPNSFLRVNKPEVDFEQGVSLYSDEIYSRGKENLDNMIKQQVMCQDKTDCFYLYRLSWRGKSQTGLVGLTSVDEYKQGLIKKHEHTRPEKVSDRADHIEKVGAQVGPVFSIFRQQDEIKSLFDAITLQVPEYAFDDDTAVRHEFWIVNDDEQIASVISTFGKLPAIYIADGHHRSAAAAEVADRMQKRNANHTGNESYNYFLNVIFPDDQLRILPYNRVVSGLNGMDCDDLANVISKTFTLTKSDKQIVPSKQYQFGVYCNKQWFIAESKEGSFDSNSPAGSIDSAVLTANWLEPLLGIEDLRTDKRVGFIGGIRGVEELVRLVDSGRYDIAFSLYPVSVEQLLSVADSNEVMPPKSTWFEPKLRSGMVVNLLEI